MAYTYTQDHNMWAQRVNKELMTASRFNMYMTKSSFFNTRTAQSPSLDLPKPNRPVTSKSLSRLSLKSKASDIKHALNPTTEAYPKPNPEEKVEFLSNSPRPASKMSSFSSAQLPKPELNENKDVQVNSRPVTRSSKAASQVKGVKTGVPYPKANLNDVEASRPSTSQYSVQSGLSKENSDALKLYIRDLENMLRQEKLKRIQSQEMLKKYVSRTPINGV